MRLRWLYYISPFQYVYTTLLRIQYVGFVFKDCPHCEYPRGRTGAHAHIRTMLAKRGTEMCCP
jgi:hypothetical protein